MISGDKLIQVACQTLRPLDTERISLTSVDVTLGDKFWVPRTSQLLPVIDLSNIPTEDELYDWVIPDEGEGFHLHPGQFIKAMTAEKFTMPSDHAAMFSLRSAIAQAGLEQSTSVWIRPDWTGNLVLELTNLTNKPLILRPGLLIGQIHFFDITPRSVN